MISGISGAIIMNCGSKLYYKFHWPSRNSSNSSWVVNEFVVEVSDFLSNTLPLVVQINL